MRIIVQRAYAAASLFLIAACSGRDATGAGEIPSNVALVLSVDSMKFAKALPAPDAGPQTIDVATAGAATVNGLAATVTYPSGPQWLTATLGSGKAPTTLTLTPVSTGALAVGTYHATVSVTSPDVKTSTTKLEVTYTVTPAAALKLSESTVYAYIAPGGGASPQTITVIDTTGAVPRLATSVRYTAGQPTGWLTAVLDKSTAPATVTVQPTTQALPNGTYTATVDVLSQDASNSPRSIAVTAIVGPLPVLTLSVHDMQFRPAGPNNNQTLLITDANHVLLKGAKAEITYPPGQPTGWVNAFEVLYGWLVNVNAGAVTPAGRGTFTAIVTISVPGALNSPQQVIVTLPI